jgi:ribosomal-protein-alanine N-acetyltransferase
VTRAEARTRRASASEPPERADLAGGSLGIVALDHAARSPEEVAEVEAIAAECFAEQGFSITEELERAWSRIWVARTAGRTVGFLVAWHVADELHVLNIAVTEALRRRGIARELMRVALRYASEGRIRIILLEVRRSNRPALKLYRSLSFSALGVRPGYYGDNGEDAVEMVLVLDPDTGQVVPSRDEIRLEI